MYIKYWLDFKDLQNKFSSRDTIHLMSWYVCWPNVTDGSTATQSCPARCPTQVHRTGAARGAAAVHQFIAIVDQKEFAKFNYIAINAPCIDFFSGEI